MLILSFSTFVMSCLAIGLDQLFSEVKRFHPLVGFGYYVSFIEKRLNNETGNGKFKNKKIKNRGAKNKNTNNNNTNYSQRLIGVLAWSLSVLPFVYFSFYLQNQLAVIDDYFFYNSFSVIVLYLAIGRSSLAFHALNVFKPLARNDSDSLLESRQQLSLIVSRETEGLNETEVSRATVESVLENGHDAVIASLFWFTIGGAPFVILHRLANTLDAMWGYKNDRFLHFGWFSARMDDWLGWPSAKITSILFALQGLFKKRFVLALKNASKQGGQYKSLNGGWVMASGATVLNTSLGGTATYDSIISTSIILGKIERADSTEQVKPEAILKSIRLVSNAVWIWLGFILLLNLLSIVTETYFA